MTSFQTEFISGKKIAIFNQQYGNEEIARVIALGKMQKDDEDPFALVNLKLLIDRYNEWKREFPQIQVHKH
uniref:Uncharacterized protein n=1 Tax=Acrobeloides nanus TaxID=290746 RepID=A0A914EDT0_9BILA